MKVYTPRGHDRRQTKAKISSPAMINAVGAVIFGMIVYLTLREPSLDFGRAIGHVNLAIVLAIAFAAVFISCVALQLLIDRKRWNAKFIAIFFTLAFLMSAALSDGALHFVDSRFEFSESVHVAKVLHYCQTQFDPARCVDQLNLCPQCKTALTLPQRKELQLKLTIFADKLDQDALAQRQAAVSGGPLSEATENWRKRQRGPAGLPQNKAN